MFAIGLANFLAIPTLSTAVSGALTALDEIAGAARIPASWAIAGLNKTPVASPTAILLCANFTR